MSDGEEGYGGLRGCAVEWWVVGSVGFCEDVRY